MSTRIHRKEGCNNIPLFLLCGHTDISIKSCTDIKMMDAREVANRVKALQGSIGKSEPADIMSQIETLKKEVAPTEEMLRVGGHPFFAA